MKNFYCDSHIHLSHAKNPEFSDDDYFCVSSCHSRSDFDFFEKLRAENKIARANLNFSASFGIHPQIVTKKYIDEDFSSDLEYLESLLSSKKIIAIGECGFDFFTKDLRATKDEQKIAFESQVFLAKNYAVPMILHIRKTVDQVFIYSNELKKIPAVIFHSFPGTLREAASILNHGVNAFFSFGKPILNGKKSAIDCVKNLPIEKLLLETDAPYQTLKDEKETLPGDIKKVYEKAAELRNISLKDLQEKILENFKKSLQTETFR